MKLRACRISVLMLFTVVPLSATPQGLEIGVEDVSVVPAGGIYADHYSRALDLSADLLAVSATYDDDVAFNAGAVYLHRWDGSAWTLEDKLVAWDGGASQEFGRALALDGDTLVVGTDKVGGGQGAAYVFVRSGGTWSAGQKLTAGDGLAGDGFGHSIALQGDDLLIGAPWTGDLGVEAGSVYLFERNGATWTESAELHAFDGSQYDWFGRAVELDGDTLAVSATSADGIQPGTGAAYVFVRSGSAWTLEDKLFAPDGQTSDYLGQSLALDGDTVVLGSPLCTVAGVPVGAACAFSRTGTSWSFDEKLLAPDGVDGDGFGTSLAIAGDTLIAGAAADDDVSLYGGSAYHYQRQGGSWMLSCKLLPTEATSGFAAQSAIDGGTFVLSSPHGGTWGSARVFTDPPRVIGVSLVFGDGSAAPCPCGNESQVGLGLGCVNSTGHGARLHGFGTTGVAADDLGAWATGLAPYQFCLLWGGAGIVGSGLGLPFGDGLRAVGGSVVRLGVRSAGSSGGARWSGGLCARAGWLSGHTVYVQAWYRDPVGGPCGFEFNTSNALEWQLTP